MTKPMRWIATLLPLLLIACGNDDTETTALPDDVTGVLRLIDLEHESMMSVKEAVLAGEFSRAEADLSESLITDNPPVVPSYGHSVPIETVDDLMSGVLVLPGHDPVTLADDPTWKETGPGDSNWIFQYHTLRWAMPLLYAWRKTDDEAYLERYLELLVDYGEDVVEADPGSVNELAWNDMGAAIRVENWLAARRILLAEGRLEFSLHARLLAWFDRHGHMLAHEVLYKPESNHGTYQSRALLALGLSLPQMVHSRDWFEIGRDRVEAQIIDMVSEEGVYAERTPQYHFMMMKVFQSVRSLMRGAGTDLPLDASRRVEQLGSVASHLIKPDGSVPMIGDSPARLSLGSYVRDHVELAFAITAGEKGTRPASRVAVLPSEGYVLLRSGWGEERPFDQETFISFDVGPSGGGHSHADALNVLYSPLGVDMLVDSGLFTYQGGEDRRYFTGPLAHNVVLPRPTPVSWPGVSESKLVHQGEREMIRSLAAVAEIEEETFWTRHVIWIQPHDLLIIDTLSAERMEGGWTQRFQLHPGTSMSERGATIQARHGEVQTDIRPLGVAGVVHEAGEEGAGWYSPSYGNRDSAPVIKVDRDGSVGPFAVLFHSHTGDDALKGFRLERRPREDLLVFVIETESGREHVFVWLDDGRVQRVEAR